MSSLWAHWMLVVVLGQAPVEDPLVKAAPAEVDVAVRIRGIEAARGDLLAMIKAMNPEWAEMVQGQLAGPIDEFVQSNGKEAMGTPFLSVLRFDAADKTSFAILVPSDDYPGVLKSLNDGKVVDLKSQDGGYDAFERPEAGGTWYATHRPGVVAFGRSRTLIADIARKDGKRLDAVLEGPIGRPFHGGDIGVYVNVASLSKTFADQIEQARQMLMNTLDQAGEQMGNAAGMKMARDMYGGMFDALKYTDGMTLNVDLDAKGMHLAGFYKLKSDSDAAKRIVDIDHDRVENMERLPAGALVYSHMNLSARTFDRLMNLSFRSFGEAVISPEFEKAMAAFHALGRIESTSSMRLPSNGGNQMFAEINVSDPREFIDAGLVMYRAMGGGDGGMRIYKDLKIERSVKQYEGMTFDHAEGTIDLERMAELTGNQPAQADLLKSMFKNGSINYWHGTDGKTLYQIQADDWEDVKSLVDAYRKGDNGVGQTEAFRAVREQLPEKASMMIMLEAHGMLKVSLQSIAATTGNPNLKVPDEDQSGEPAYIGGSLTPHASSGYEFHLVVPSAVGTVVAKAIDAIRPDQGADR